MSRFSPKSEAELAAGGYTPINTATAARLTRYGVPVVQKGMLALSMSRFTHWGPAWALELIHGWPWEVSSVDDFDHDLLKKVVRAISRSGDIGSVDAYLTVARLGGVEAVRKMLEAGGDDD